MTAPVCGIRPPAPAPAPRDPLTIAAELRRAADHLRFVADDLAAGVTDGAVTEADTIITGIGRLLVELRQRGAP